MEQTTVQQDYATKMDDAVTKAMNEWWKSLSKEDLLSYLADHPDVTADTLRAMIAGTGTTLSFDIDFNATQALASADFRAKN